MGSGWTGMLGQAGGGVGAGLAWGGQGGAGAGPEWDRAGQGQGRRGTGQDRDRVGGGSADVISHDERLSSQNGLSRLLPVDNVL